MIPPNTEIIKITKDGDCIIHPSIKTLEDLKTAIKTALEKRK